MGRAKRRLRMTRDGLWKFDKSRWNKPTYEHQQTFYIGTLSYLIRKVASGEFSDNGENADFQHELMQLANGRVGEARLAEYCGARCEYINRKGYNSNIRSYFLGRLGRMMKRAAAEYEANDGDPDWAMYAFDIWPHVAEYLKRAGYGFKGLDVGKSAALATILSPVDAIPDAAPYGVGLVDDLLASAELLGLLDD